MLVSWWLNDAESVWRELRQCLLESAVEVCGKTKQRHRQMEAWWWTEAVAKAIKVKRNLYLAWSKSKELLKQAQDCGEEPDLIQHVRNIR